MSQFTEFYNGQSTNAYELLGCHRAGEGTYRFAVWAPNAVAVSVIGDFNNWLVNHDAMVRDDGIWEITLEAKHGDCYKYAITTQSGNVLYKADPYGTCCELRPKTASVIYDPSEKFVWTDDDWTAKQSKKDVYKAPINIYEVHAGSWRRHYAGICTVTAIWQSTLCRTSKKWATRTWNLCRLPSIRWTHPGDTR